MNRLKNTLSWLAITGLAVALGALSGCSTAGGSGSQMQAANSGASVQTGTFPQTTKALIVDPAHPPKEGAEVVRVYKDALYGTTEVRSDDYLRHIDPQSSTGWTPWHYRTAPHTWGDEPVAAAQTPSYTPGLVNASYDYPSGNAADTVMTIHRQAPAEVIAGQSYTSDMSVINNSDHRVCNVVVTQHLSPDFDLVSAEPQQDSIQDRVVQWKLGDFGPKETRSIKVTGKATKPGSVTDCATVTYNPCTCLTVNAIQPALALTKTMPAEALMADVLPTTFTVKNTGTGLARDVVLKDPLPRGLLTQDNKDLVEVSLGDIPSGATREAAVNLKATQPGQYTNKATATGSGGLSAEAVAEVIIRRPVLKITKTGPQREYIGREFTYEITVTNTGDGAAKDTVVMDPIPEASQFVSATEEGASDGSKVTWHLGTLAPQDTKTVGLTLKGPAPATIVNTATATAYSADTVEAKAQTIITGIPAILLEMVDNPDPVEIGKTTTYTITVTNQGTAADSNIKIACEMEDSMEYVSSSGATTGAVEGQNITFGTLDSLAPKDQAQWKVMVKALKPGDVRFKVTMTSDQAKRPVVKTEASNFYK